MQTLIQCGGRDRVWGHMYAKAINEMINDKRILNAISLRICDEFIQQNKSVTIWPSYSHPSQTKRW